MKRNRRSCILPLTLTAVLSIIPHLVCAQDAPAKNVFTLEEIEAAEMFPEFFTVDEKSIVIEEIAPLQPGDKKPAQAPVPFQPKEGIGDTLVEIDKIINIALKIWQIIEDNKPVVDISTTYATAMPQGISHWSELNGWQPPEGTVYGFYADNLYGVRVINVRYQVFRTCGGNYEGKGKYLTGVTVAPLLVEVAWGYKFSIGAKVPGVTNVGTSTDPVAAMSLYLNWKIATAMKESRGTDVYYIQGDGVFKRLGSPFGTRKVDARAILKKIQPEITIRIGSVRGWE